jgi:flagellar basal body-associated protein FliL
MMNRKRSRWIMIVSSGAVFMIALLAGWWFINRSLINPEGRRKSPE